VSGNLKLNQCCAALLGEFDVKVFLAKWINNMESFPEENKQTESSN
jgi:hypothetical protein